MSPGRLGKGRVAEGGHIRRERAWALASSPSGEPPHEDRYHGHRLAALTLALAACGGSGDDTLGDRAADQAENRAEALEANGMDDMADRVEENGYAREEAIDDADVNADAMTAGAAERARQRSDAGRGRAAELNSSGAEPPPAPPTSSQQVFERHEAADADDRRPPLSASAKCRSMRARAGSPR